MVERRSPLTLRSVRSQCTAGGVVDGEVELHFPQVHEDEIENVEVRFRGFVRSELKTDSNDAGTLERDTLEVVRRDSVIWRKGTLYPPPGSDALRVPFEISIPDDLPPPFFYKNEGMLGSVLGSIAYDVQVVGVRPGTNISLMPTAITVSPVSTEGHQLQARFRRGWDGLWTTSMQSTEVRQNVFGGPSHVKIAIKLPSVPGYPRSTPIPYSITVSTASQPMKRTKIAADKPVFPAPPRSSQEVKLTLTRDLHLRARSREARPTDTVAFSSGLLPNNPAFRKSSWERRWVPVQREREKGVWKQEITYSSTFELSCIPSFGFPILKNTYTLHLSVRIGGLSSPATLDVPINVLSEAEPPQPDPPPATPTLRPPPSRAPSRASTLPLYVQGPDAPGLPPSYWDVADGSEGEMAVSPVDTIAPET